MSTQLKIFLTILVISIIGVYAYLGWVYFIKPKRLSSTVQTATKSNQIPGPIKIDISQATEYQGNIFCTKAIEKGTSLASCENLAILMENSKTYELALFKGVSASNFVEQQKVKVLGIIGQISSPLGPISIIGVFDISGI